MSARVEFSRKVRAQAHLRANGCCEACGARLKVGEGEYDHILACELGGEATLENCRLICTPCHKAKTAADVRRIRKADRQRDKASGAFKTTSRPLPCGRRSPFKKKMNGEVVAR